MLERGQSTAQKWTTSYISILTEAMGLRREQLSYILTVPRVQVPIVIHMRSHQVLVCCLRICL